MFGASSGPLDLERDVAEDRRAAIGHAAGRRGREARRTTTPPDSAPVPETAIIRAPDMRDVFETVLRVPPRMSASSSGISSSVAFWIVIGGVSIHGPGQGSASKPSRFQVPSRRRRSRNVGVADHHLARLQTGPWPACGC